MGLPTKQVELPVRGGGRVLGTFILTPTPAAPVSQQQCVVAVALVDQLGAALGHRVREPSTFHQPGWVTHPWLQPVRSTTFRR